MQRLCKPALEEEVDSGRFQMWIIPSEQSSARRECAAWYLKALYGRICAATA